MILATYIFTLLYIVLIFSFIIGFNKIPFFESERIIPKNSFSIIIPFRNEVTNLGNLLNSINELNYPIHLFEVLLVNDASTDDSCEIIASKIKQYNLKNIQVLNLAPLKISTKKKAIDFAIEKAKFTWILTTDADCELPKLWLQTYNEFIEKEQPYFITAPVKFIEENSFLFHFQNLNFLSLIGSTIGSFGIKKPFLCNGANICYRKDIFKQLNGFEGNLPITSGDDIFLLEKMIKNYPNKTKFLKSDKLLVETKSLSSWNLFLNQQLRWASKSTSYKNWFAILVGIIILLLNSLIVLVTFSLIIRPENWKFLITILLQKMLFDIILIEKTATFVHSKISIINYIIISIIYPFFIVLITTLSLFKKYEWKGRKISK